MSFFAFFAFVVCFASLPVTTSVYRLRGNFTKLSNILFTIFYIYLCHFLLRDDYNFGIIFKIFMLVILASAYFLITFSLNKENWFVDEESNGWLKISLINLGVAVLATAVLYSAFYLYVLIRVFNVT